VFFYCLSGAVGKHQNLGFEAKENIEKMKLLFKLSDGSCLSPLGHGGSGDYLTTINTSSNHACSCEGR